MSDELLSRWRGASWQIIAEHAAAPVTHVALDEAILTSVMQHKRGPTLRFWGWQAPGVILGRFQSYRNEIDPEGAAALGLRVVRRMSGGGAMLVQPDMTITYSVYVPTKLLEGITIRDSYRLCDSWVVEILRELGADVTYVPLNDISSPQGKVGGAAQARRPGVVLHHTTIAYEMIASDLVRVLRIGREKLSDKGTPSADKRVHPLGEQIGMSRGAIVERMIQGFQQRFGGDYGKITDDEHRRAGELVAQRYDTDAWTFELP